MLVTVLDRQYEGRERYSSSKICVLSFRIRVV